MYRKIIGEAEEKPGMENRKDGDDGHRSVLSSLASLLQCDGCEIISSQHRQRMG